MYQKGSKLSLLAELKDEWELDNIFSSPLSYVSRVSKLREALEKRGILRKVSNYMPVNYDCMQSI